MGEILRHGCETYGYSAEVGGGATGGMRAIMITIACRDCLELRDYLVVEWQDGEVP